MSDIAERGLKRICQSCGTRFYDLNKRPILCPNCKAEFSGDMRMKSRRGRVAANDLTEEKAGRAAPVETAAPMGDEDDLLSHEEDLVSLDDAAAMEGGDDEASDDDIDLGEDLADLDEALVEDEDLDAEDLDVDLDEDES